jgi:hypothetical protein
LSWHHHLNKMQCSCWSHGKIYKDILWSSEGFMVYLNYALNSWVTNTVSGHNSVPYLNRTPIFKWCVVRCRSKNGCQKDMMCLKEIGLHAQTCWPFIPDSIVNIKMRPSYGSLSVDFDNSEQVKISSKTFWEWSWLLQTHLQMHSNVNLVIPSSVR